MKRLFTCFLLVLTSISCRHEANAVLNLAESLLQQRADSALLILNSIDPHLLKRKETEARYALLKSAALDKNHIDITSDSLITTAVDYYSRHGNSYRRMLAWYYDGIVLKNAEKYSSSIIAFENAEKEALVLDDSYHLGLIYRNKADLFNKSYNNQEALEHRKKAAIFFKKAEALPYLAYAELALATDYSNDKQYTLSDSLLQSIQQHYSDQHIIAYSTILRASLLVKTDNDTKTALQLFRKTPFFYYSLLDYAQRALAHERVMERDSADFWLSVAYSLCKNSTDSLSIDYIKSKILHRRGQHDVAFPLIEKVLAAEDSLTRIKLYQSVSGSQRDYFKAEALRQEEQLRNAKKERILGWTIGLLLLLVGIFWFIGYSREKDRQLQEQITRLAIKERELTRTNKTNAHLLGSLLSSRIEHLDQLSRAYFDTDNKREKEALFTQIKESVCTLRNNPDMLVSLEEDLNRYCNGIMSKLRTQVPRIKGNSIRRITLFFAGFPYEVVQLITNSPSIDSLKMARSRYRKEIMAANAPDEAFFLEMLEMKRPSQL